MLDGELPATLPLFTAAMRARTGHSIIVVPVASHAGIESVLDRGVADLGWAPPLVALDLVAFGSARLLVTVSRGGRTAYPSVLVVHRDRGIRTLADLPGTRVAWVSRLSAAGYEVPRLFLEASGLALDDLFAEELVAGGHLSALAHVAAGRVDVAACYGVRDDHSSALELPIRGSALRILAVAGPVPSDVLLSGRSVDPATAERLAAALVSLDDVALSPLRELLGIERFVRPSPRHLDPLSSLRALARDARVTAIPVG